MRNDAARSSLSPHPSLSTQLPVHHPSFNGYVPLPFSHLFDIGLSWDGTYSLLALVSSCVYVRAVALVWSGGDSVILGPGASNSHL